MKIVLSLLFIVSSTQACMTPKDKEIFAELVQEFQETEVAEQKTPETPTDELKKVKSEPKHADTQNNKVN